MKQIQIYPMQINSVSLYEETRLQKLYSYNILDSAPEREFDDLVELAAQIYGCPIAAITFIDDSRQWFKAIKGIGVSETSKDISFCSYAIEQNDIMIVKDATLDSRFCNNPLVTSEPSIRFYAGVPIVSGTGHHLGSVCIIDQKPRSLNAGQLNALEIISRQVSKLLELRLKNALLQNHAEKKMQAQKVLIQKTMLVQEESNSYISTELHENIAQGLTATKLYLDMATTEINFPYLEKCKENVTKMIDHTRNLSQKLLPTTLKDSPLAELIQPLLAAFQRETSCTIKLSSIAPEKIPAVYVTILFRMIEEQLKNILQHAKATHVTIEVKAKQAIELVIADDGIGVNTRNFKKGYGISKIVLLADYYNGTVNIESDNRKGCRLRIFIPLVNKITKRNTKASTESPVKIV